MNTRTQYLIQILESIGLPLMGAVAQNQAQTLNAPQADAQTIAILLSKTVEASVGLRDILGINPLEAEDDTLRVAMAGLAGPLVAAHFTKGGTAPESADLQNMATALKSTLTFAENFTPTPEAIERLKQLKAAGQYIDGYQTQIQTMQAFVPVVEAITIFSFGQPDTQAFADISNRLIQKSNTLRTQILPDLTDDGEQKLAAAAILHVMAQLYSDCHKSEAEKALKMDEATRVALNIDNVWNIFETRAQMLSALTSSMVPQNVGAAGSGTVAPAVNVPPPAPEPPPPPEPEGKNPMAMFAKPKPQGGAISESAASKKVEPATGAPLPPMAPPMSAPLPKKDSPPPQPAQPIAQTPPPVMPVQAAPTTPPAVPTAPVQPVATAPAQPPVTPQTAPPITSAPPQQPPPVQPPITPPPTQPPAAPKEEGGPMAFFKKKDEGS